MNKKMDVYMKGKMLPPIIACLLVQLSVGIIYLWSVFSSKAVLAFQWNTAEAKMVSSYMLFAYVLGNLGGGFLNDRKGPRVTCIIGIVLFAAGITASAFVTPRHARLLYLTYCCLGGLGSGCAYGACISCIQKWLPHKRGLAAGLAVSAFGLSSVVFAPVSQMLMNRHMDADGIVDFYAVFLILGSVFFAVGLVSCLFISVPEEESSVKNAADAVRNYTLREAMKTAPFWCMFLYILFSNGTWNLTVPLIRDLGIERGLSESMAVFCVSITGVASALGRLSVAAASDYFGRTRTVTIFTVVTLVGGLLLTFVPGAWYIVVIAIVAFAFGGPCATNAAISTDFFGTKYSGSVYGFMMLALGVSSIGFNWVANTLLHGAVVTTFLMAAASAAVAVVLMLFMGRFEKKWNAIT